MIDKEDCVSITDRTFDLSLDDPLSDASSTAVDSLTDHGATTIGGPPPKNRLQSFLTDDSATGKDDDQSARFTDAQPRWCFPHKVDTPIKQVSRTATSIHQEKTTSTVADVHLHDDALVNKLKTAIHVLIQLSGNTVDATPKEMGLNELVEMVAKLTEASDYKMRFLAKNYRFLESIYDSTRKELDSSKEGLQRSTERIRQLEEELHEQEEKQHALRQQLQVKEDRQRTMLGQNYTTSMHDAKEVIDRQQREIKEYKLFIKQMMDRE